MSLVAIVFRNNQPICAFYSVQRATAYSQRVALNAETIRIQLLQLDLVPWDDMLYGRQDNDEIVWDGSITATVDATTIYRIPLI